MNVLILTPDRVGSTLLQRLLTVYMLRKEFDKPVINLHELTNGLMLYYNELLNQKVLGKPENWGYYQTLPEIIDLLKEADHIKTSRLAHYHMVRRQDSIQDQLDFYDYLNKNFFVISCRRDNLLEHGLSWAIHAHSKKLNVYSPLEKIDTFGDLYANGITVDKITLTTYLQKYKDYLRWVDQNFHVQSYFDYEHDMANIEKYILNLDFMRGSENNTWQDMFGQNFENFNACHRMIPNMVMASNQDAASLIDVDNRFLTPEQYTAMRGSDWPEISDNALVKVDSLPAFVKKEIGEVFNIPTVQVKATEQEAKFLSQNLSGYLDTTHQMANLVHHGFMVTSIPLKLQSLSEKKQMIKNFSECVEWYNEWVNTNGVGKTYTEQELTTLSTTEERRLTAPVTGLLTASV